MTTALSTPQWRNWRFAGAIFAIALLAIQGATPLQAGNAQLLSITSEPVKSRPNLLPNPSFEETIADGLPLGWVWNRGATDAACKSDNAAARRGSKSLVFRNGTAFGPQIYGMLWLEKPVRLTQGRTYTMSAWVKSEDPGVFNLIGGGDWQYRVAAANTEGQWQRIALTFKAGERDLDFTFRINTESETRGVWVDDVKLEEGDSATVDPGRGSDPVLLSSHDPNGVIEGDGAFQRLFLVDASRAIDGQISLALGTNPPLRQPFKSASGLCQITVKGESSAMSDTPVPLAVSIEQDGRSLASLNVPLHFFSESNALERLAALRRRVPELESAIQAVKATGQDAAYPMVTFTIIKNFVNYAEEDARRGETRRSLEQIGEMESMSARLKTDLDEAIKGKRPFAAVPRWTGEKRPVIHGSAFVAPTRMPDGTTADRPVFFTGYGHFGQVVNDMEKWPDYGGNIIQIEIGPSRVFPAEGKTDDSASKELLDILNRAQKSGVAVCLLISPHYFPDWALKKWSALNVHREGFLGYCIHAPEGRELLKQFVHALLEPVKDHPALHSVCLSNEPVNEEAPCAPARARWQAWLARRHGSIAALNSIAGSNFTDFASVLLPDPFGPRPATALWLDFIRFNQEVFADWHQMLADAVHETAPGLPVHAKAMTWTMLNDSDVKWGVDATLFSRFSNINGNDSANMYDFTPTGFAQGWEMNAMAYDLQRSVLDAPVFNTENHLITDRDTRGVPPAHIRTALWQAAVHGQSATTIWVWERTFDAKSDFAGSIMHRPACAEAVGVVGYDLNRAAEAVTALQQAPAQALLLQSSSSMIWEGAEHTACSAKLYTALSFSGIKIGFITERQLEAGIVPAAPVLFIPAITHLSEAASASLSRYKGRLVMAGRDNLLTRDEYDRERKTQWAADTLAFDRSIAPTKLLDLITPRLGGWNLNPQLQLSGRNTSTWGVECRSVQTTNGLIANVCNYQKTPVTVSLITSSRWLAPVDMLTGEKIPGALTLAPLEFRLLQFK